MCAEAVPLLLDEDLLRWFYGGTPPADARPEPALRDAEQQPDDALVA